MRFRAHETFFIRKGWLNKGVRNVAQTPGVFLGDAGNPMDILGIGSNMVKSLRYWLQATGLTVEPPRGRRNQALTQLGEIIMANDPYTEETGTLWLIHYRLASNLQDATAWYYFFNEFKPAEFDRDDFVLHIKNFLRVKGNEDVSERSLEDDYNCIINTYMPRAKTNPEKIDPESNIDCPLGELGLVDFVDKKRKTYKKAIPSKESIHPYILLAVMLEQANGERRVKLSSLQNDINNVCKIFSIDIITLTYLLTQLELMGLVKVIRTAGLDIVEIHTPMGFYDCVNAYYAAING